MFILVYKVTSNIIKILLKLLLEKDRFKYLLQSQMMCLHPFKEWYKKDK